MNVFDRDDVLAGASAQLEVWASAAEGLNSCRWGHDPLSDLEGGRRVWRDSIGSWPTLRGDDPAVGVPSQRHRRCDLHALEFSGVDRVLPSGMYLLGLYLIGISLSIPDRDIPPRYSEGHGRESAALGLSLPALRARVATANRSATEGLPEPEMQVSVLGEATTGKKTPSDAAHGVRICRNKRGGGRPRTSDHRSQNPALFLLSYAPIEGSWGVGQQTMAPWDPVSLGPHFASTARPHRRVDKQQRCDSTAGESTAGAGMRHVPYATRRGGGTAELRTNARTYLSAGRMPWSGRISGRDRYCPPRAVGRKEEA